MSSSPVIEISGLNKFYGKTQVLDNLSFTVNKGEIFGYLGPNGSGKSTTIKILCGLAESTSGSAKILGLDTQEDMDQIRHKIGYMSQKFGLYDELTVMQNLRFYSGLYGIRGEAFKERLEEVIKLTRIRKYLNYRAGFLSGGWKQRLALGCAIIHKPQVIFLDEPTAGIDPVARRDLWDLLFDLASQGVTMFVTTHYMDEAERCNRVAYIFEGKLIAYGSSYQLRSMDGITPPHSRRLEVYCKPLMRAYRLLDKQPMVKDCTIFGTLLHLIVDDALSDSDLSALLAEQEITVGKIKTIKPTLEDVFVTLTQQAVANREAHMHDLP